MLKGEEMMRNCGVKFRLAAVFLTAFAALTLSACGADVQSVTNVDEEFCGTREITVLVDDYDMVDYVEGGVDAMEEVFEENLPPEMTMTRKYDPEGTAFVFKIEFDGVEDYTEKVTAILARDPEYDLNPEVEFEVIENPFKESVVAEENFSTSNLIAWAVEALDESGIITYSSKSSWYSINFNTFEIDGKEPYTYQGNMNVNEAEYTTFDSIDVVTEFNYDGTYSRTIEFEIGNMTIAKLDNKGIDVEEYLTELADEGVSGTDMTAPVTETEEENKKTYTVEFTSANAEDIAKVTSALLDTECTFSVDMTADDLVDNVVNIDVTEYISGKTYFAKRDYSNRIHSKYKLYNGVEFDVDNSESYIGKQADEDGTEYFVYSPMDEEVKYSFNWAVVFDAIDMTLVLDKEEISHEVSFSLDNSIPEIVRQTAQRAFNNSIPDKNVKFETKSEEGRTVYTVKFAKDDTAEVVKRINYFISAYTKQDSTASVKIEPVAGKTTAFTKHYAVVADISYNAFAAGEGQYTSNISGSSSFMKFNARNSLSEEYLETITSTDTENAAISYDGFMQISNIGLVILIVALVLAVVVITLVVVLLVTRNKQTPTFTAVADGEPVQAIETAPAVPVAEIAPVAEAVPVAEVAPTEETPVAETAPVEEVAPTEEVVPEENIPVAEVTPVEETAPEEEVPAEENAPTEETVAAEETTPTEETV